MIFKRLKLIDFLSFQEQEVFFENIPKLLTGENLTDDGQESNGSGKSALMAGIQYALFGTNSRKELGKNLIRHGQTSALTELDIRCDVREQTLLIIREQKKSGAKLNLYIDEVSDDTKVDFSTIADGDKFIMEWMDSSKEDIMSYYLIDKEKYKSFFSPSDKANRLALISRISDTSFTDDIDSNIKADIAVKEDELDTVKGQISKLDGSIEEIDGQIRDLNLSGDDAEEKQKAIEAVEGEIKSLERRVLELTTDIVNNQDRLKIKEKVLADKEKELGKLKPIDTEGLETTLKELTEQIVDTGSVKFEAEKNIQGKIDCPKCSHSFALGDEDIDFNVEIEVVESCEELIEELTKEKSSIEVEISKADDVNKKIRLVKREVESAKTDVGRAERNVERSEADKQRTLDSIESKKQRVVDIENAEAKDNSLQIEQLKVKRQDRLDQKLKKNGELDDMVSELEELVEWRLNFAKFKMYLANGTMKVIQDSCNHNLNKLGSDLRLRIDGFKVKGDGSIKEEITPLVVREYEKSFHSYSNGERARVEFAMIMTVQDILNSLNKYGGLNFLSVDEIFEGLDGMGLISLFESIKHLGQTVLLTTHVKDDRLVEDSILVQKVNGISRII